MEQDPPTPDNAASTRQCAAEDLFDAVRELPEHARDEAIDAGSDDPWVRAEVRSLLRFDSPAAEEHAKRRTTDFDADACIGLSTGGFTLRRVIGVGGMGTVFEADQELPSRRIAVKVLHAAAARESTLARFRKESEFLARLDHPNIARVIAAGTLRVAGDDRGRPYFAMELVDGGRPITVWARDGHARHADIARMMATACDAVGSGHRAGIVHLDLKPGNLLVSESGALRVIDYGIARSVGDSEGAGDMSFAGTPQYMAPEQCAHGGRVDSRADVYALGLILFELLAQRLPYDTRGASWREIVRRVRETEPPDLRRVDSTIPRELEAIVRRATAKDPNARYGTASELGDDLRRWLDDEPVLAMEPRLLDTAHHLVRRNPAAAVLALVALLAVAAGVLLSVIFALRASNAAALQRLAAARANLQAASGAVAAKMPAEAVTNLASVPADLRGWESRHLAARVSNYELYAVAKSEMISVDSIDATGEVAGGVTGGRLLIADRTGRSAPVVYDLRGAYAAPDNASLVAVAGTADGRRIFVATNEFNLLMIDRDAETMTRVAQGVLRVMPAGRLVVGACIDGSVRLIDPDAVTEVARCAPAGVELTDASIGEGGRHALLALSDGSLRMIDIDPEAGSVRERWRTSPGAARTRAPAVSRDGTIALVAWRDDRITRHDPATGAVVAEVDLPGGSVFTLTVSPDNRLAAASSWTRQVRIIDTASLAVQRSLGGTTYHVWGVDFTADGSRLVGGIMPDKAVDAEGVHAAVMHLGAWLVDSDAAVRDQKVCGPTVAASTGPDAGCCTLVDAEGAIWEFRARDGSTRKIGDGPLRGARVARSRDWLAIGDMQGTLHFYRLRDGVAVEGWKTKIFEKPLSAVAASPDGTRILVGEADRSVAAVSASDGAILWKREIPMERVPRSRRFVSKFVFLEGGELVTYAAALSEVPRAVFRTGDGSLVAGRAFGGTGESEDALYRKTDGNIYAVGITGELIVRGAVTGDRVEKVALNGGVLCMNDAEDRLFMATRDGSMRVVGFEPFGIITRLDAPSGAPIAIDFDDEADALTVVTNRGVVRTWFGTRFAGSERGTQRAAPAPDGLRTLRLLEPTAAK